MTNSHITNFFKNETVFITGGTGLVGKLVTEKLLRSCDVQRIYLLVRPKRGKNPDERFKNFFNNPCFDLIKNTSLTAKVRLVGGDCSKHLLGLSLEDIGVLKEDTTCFFHLAANVRFDQSLKEASNILRATNHILELAKYMPNLKVLVYVSTAYSNCIHSHIKEDFYQPPIQPETLLDLVHKIDDATLQKITPFMLGKWPNTYVYTKSISEDAVRRADLNVPVVIIRPAIITNTINEPIVGWIENANAYIGMMTAVSLGIVRSLWTVLENKTNLVPADYVSNIILAAAAKQEQKKLSVPIIYNIVGGQITCEDAAKIYHSFYWEFPSVKYLWYYSDKLTESRMAHYAHYYYCLLFTYLIDAVLFCVGKERMAVRKYKSINEMINSQLYFAVHEWKFDNNNVVRLWNEMSDEDKKIFNFNSKITDWQDYLRNCAIGVRKYILQDPLETLPAAKKKLKILFLVHYAIVSLWCYYLYRFVLFIENLVL